MEHRVRRNGIRRGAISRPKKKFDMNHARKRRPRIGWSLACLLTFASSSRVLAQRAGDAGDARLARSIEAEGAAAGGSWRGWQRWDGSYVSFDQSATTQTLRLGSDFQSADPVYELWLAVKPQYTFIDRPRDKLSASVWLNAFLELTDSDTTTRTHEILLGPTYVTVPYVHTLGSVFGRRLTSRPGYKTSISVGPRLILPTDKAAWNSGYIINVGVASSVSQAVPLRGSSARFWTDGLLSLGVSGGFPITRATSPVDPDLQQPRQDVAGRLIQSDQLRGQMNSKAYLNVSLAANVHVTHQLSVELSYVALNAWAYAPDASSVCNLLTGCAKPMSIADPTTYRVSSWLTMAMTYDIARHLGLSVGYFNRASQLGPDGQRRSPLWSPEARFFVTLTGTLATDE
jgi:hypothetical protein